MGAAARCPPHLRGLPLVAALTACAWVSAAGTTVSVGGTAVVAAPSEACTDRIVPGFSVFRGGVLSGTANATGPDDCCTLCHGLYKDECQGWEFINFTDSVVASDHNCDIFARVGPLRAVPGRTAGVPPKPVPPPPGPPPPQVGTPCHSDADCASQWGGAEWRCLERLALPSDRNSCHMHAETVNTTCACQPSACNGGLDTANASPRPSNSTTRLYVIGDSISTGMQSSLTSLLDPDGWAVHHNPGNGDNTNYGAHCLPTWLPPTGPPFDVISFQFGLHDIAHDEEQLTVAQYTALLTNITAHLVGLQRQHSTKLLWVRTTPVPTVPAYGFGCNGSALTCLNPARFIDDVVSYNAAADGVMAAAVANGARIGTADLFGFVVGKCGGHPVYSACPGFQLENNVHFTPTGWAALAAEMRRNLLAL